MKTMSEKTDKIVRFASMGLGLLAFILLALVLILPVINIRIAGSNNAYYDFANGQNFVGWQVIFYDFGVIRPIVADRNAFGFNIMLFLGFFLPLLALLIFTPKLRKATGVKKIVYEAITAALLLFGAIVFLSATTLIEQSAGNLIYDSLLLAKEMGSYKLGWYAVFMPVVLIVIAVMKLGNVVYTALAGKTACDTIIAIDTEK